MTPDAMPQVKRDFDAALRRASQNKTDKDDHDVDKFDPSDRMYANLTVLGSLASLPLSTTPSQAVAADAAMGGSAIATAAPNTHNGTLPDSTPMKAGTTATDQQWRLNIPGNDPSSSAMTMRLVDSGAGHWQVRLAADPATRQQLTPELDQWRDQLRQNSGHRIDDLVFDDDIDPESDAGTPT